MGGGIPPQPLEAAAQLLSQLSIHFHLRNFCFDSNKNYNFFFNNTRNVFH